MWDRVSLSFAIEKTLKEIFGAIIFKDDLDLSDIENKIEQGLSEDESREIATYKEVKACRKRFESIFKSNIFCDCYAILYDIIVNLRIVQFSKEQMLEIVDNNTDLILDSPYINISNFNISSDGNIASDDDVIQIFKEKLAELYDEVTGKFVREETFVSDCNLYIDWYTKQFATYTALNMSSIMSQEGLEVKEAGKKRVVYKGIQGLNSYFNKQMLIIRELDKNNRIRHSILDQEFIEDEASSNTSDTSVGIFDTGIKEIDSVLGKFRRGNVLGIMGPPKGGKTRFTAYLANRALELGLNVCVWPLEGTKEEWISMIKASTIASSTGKNNRENMIRINSSDILQNKISDQKLSRIIASSTVSIAINPKRGRLSFIEGTAYVEDFLQELESHYENKNQFDVVIIDPLINIMGKGRVSKSERISEAYISLKAFVENGTSTPIIAIIPCQMKQTAIDEMRRNGEDADIDVTAGGESSETIRTPDVVIGIYSSKEERKNNMTNLYSVANRHSLSFDNFTARAYYGSCYFCSMEQ